MTTMKVQATAPEGRPTITLERDFDAPVSAVFDAYSTAEALARWWGPNGFTLAFKEMEFRVGGRARFDMTGPDGTVYPNRIVYLEIEPAGRILYRHDGDVDDDPRAFQVTVTFAPLPGGRTRLAMTSVFASVEARNAVLQFGAAELGKQTVEKLAGFVEQPADRRELVITRTFDAPARLLFAAWSRPEHLIKWFGPVGWPLTLCEVDFRMGGRFRFAMTGPDGVQNTPFGGEYLAIEPDRKIVFDNGFEEAGAPRMITTVTFEDQGGRTLQTHHTLFQTAAMRDEYAKLGFEGGVNSGLDQLAQLLADGKIS